MRDDPTEFYFAGLKINEDVADIASMLGLVLILTALSGPDANPSLVGDLERDGTSSGSV